MRAKLTPDRKGIAGVVYNLLLVLGLVLNGESGAAVPEVSPQAPQSRHPALLRELLPCDNPGWFPTDFGLKDHTIFWHDSLYYLASIYLAQDGYEQRFAYASSPDLCHWTDLGGILQQRIPDTWAEFRIWAPFVYEEAGVYYMYYTGVTAEFTQSILLATSPDPSDPGSWQPRVGMVFQPYHPDVVWPGNGFWSDCRDPTVIKVGSLYHLYYTGMSREGGIVGLATSSSPLGPWVDLGPVARSTTDSIPESPILVRYGVYSYLLYNDAGVSGLGQVVRFGPTLAGPWSAPRPFRPGWAHEIWIAQDGEFYTSYVWQGGVAIRPLTWNDFYDPPLPFIGLTPHHVLLPMVQR